MLYERWLLHLQYNRFRRCCYFVFFLFYKIVSPVRMRKDCEENNIQHEATLMSLRKKHNDAVAEMSEQIDQLNKMRARVEKDKGTVRMQLEDTRAAIEHVGHERSVAEKNLKALDAQLGGQQKKIDDAVASLVRNGVASTKYR